MHLWLVVSRKQLAKRHRATAIPCSQKQSKGPPVRLPQSCLPELNKYVGIAVINECQQ